jgi:hypothetical protein
VTGYDRLAPGTACVECAWSKWCLFCQRRGDRCRGAVDVLLNGASQATVSDLFPPLSALRVPWRLVAAGPERAIVISMLRLFCSP